MVYLFPADSGAASLEEFEDIMSQCSSFEVIPPTRQGGGGSLPGTDPVTEEILPFDVKDGRAVGVKQSHHNSVTTIDTVYYSVLAEKNGTIINARILGFPGQEDAADAIPDVEKLVVSIADQL